MAGRVSRGVNVASTSWHVLRSEPKLLVYPAIALGGQLAILGVFALAAFGSGASTEHITPGNALGVYLYFVASSAVSAWAAAGITIVVQERLNGGNAPWTIGFSGANKHLPALIGWAMLTSLVTLVLRVLEDKLGWLGRLLTIGGAVAWSVATLMVIPVIVLENENPVSAVSRSSKLFVARWGETVAGGFANGVRIFGAWLAAFLVVFVSFLINPMLGLVALVFCVVTILLITDALESVFTAALYSYARTGELPRFFTRSELGIPDDVWLEQCMRPATGR